MADFLSVLMIPEILAGEMVPSPNPGAICRVVDNKIDGILSVYFL